uniref:Uncharacterized protein n=1 Tax=Anguilla anguilla TaxID=7936 RepID=A0A0E9TF12_ANGAN
MKNKSPTFTSCCIANSHILRG